MSESIPLGTFDLAVFALYMVVTMALGFLVAGIPVRVILKRKFAISALQRLFVAAARDAQYFVIISFGNAHRLFKIIGTIFTDLPRLSPWRAEANGL